MKLFESIKRWYCGEFVVFKNDPNSDLVVIGGSQEYSPSAKIARVAVQHLAKEGKWWIGTAIAVAGLLFAWQRSQQPVPAVGAELHRPLVPLRNPLGTHARLLEEPRCERLFVFRAPDRRNHLGHGKPEVTEKIAVDPDPAAERDPIAEGQPAPDVTARLGGQPGQPAAASEFFFRMGQLHC